MVDVKIDELARRWEGGFLELMTELSARNWGAPFEASVMP